MQLAKMTQWHRLFLTGCLWMLSLSTVSAQDKSPVKAAVDAAKSATTQPLASAVKGAATKPTTLATTTPSTKPTTKPSTQPAKEKDGWFPKLSLGLNISLSSTQNVPGVEDGITFTLGGVLNGGLLMRFGQHKWDSTLKVVHTQTKTPQIDAFIKTADSLDLKSAYSFQFRKDIKLGIRFGLDLTTPLFPGFFVPAANADITLINNDNTQDQRTVLKEESFLLTDPFSPLTFKQAIGIEAEPYRNKFTTISSEVNLSAQQTWAKGYVLQDDPTTPRLEFRELRDFVQLGLELKLGFTGKMEQFLTYDFLINLMVPFITSVPTTLQGFELLNADIQFKVTLKMAEWASLNYVFRAQRLPILTENWQVSNNLVLSFTANLF
jgi:hypothetical protein